MNTLRFLAATRRVLNEVSFPGYRFRLSEANDHLILQVECDDTCNVTGKKIHWKGRKWRLSLHMTKSEIVQTAFKAVLTAVEHETRENFTYKGASIFDPHYDVDRLVELRESESALEVRIAR